MNREVLTSLVVRPLDLLVGEPCNQCSVQRCGSGVDSELKLEERKRVGGRDALAVFTPWAAWHAPEGSDTNYITEARLAL